MGRPTSYPTGVIDGVSIWCPGSSEKVYMVAKTVRCPSCHKVVEVTRQGHIKPHVESKTESAGKK